MSEFGKRFVIDTNTLTSLRLHRRASDFFLENSIIPDEVLREAAGFPDIGNLKLLSRPTTARTLKWLTEVMATVKEGETQLVDLYSNKGGADPLVVAYALEGQEWDSQFIDAPSWIVVTGDDAVRRKAQEFQLQVLSNVEFSDLIDGEIQKFITELQD